MNNNIKQKIIEYNSQFGIKTEFITAGDVLGYSLGNTIYINESIEQDYERTNKHELLHFYENTEEFERIKQKLLQEHKDELNEIRSEYELRYYGLYSKEEIKAGVLDNEIVIDMMVDNSSIEYEDGLKIGEEFLGQIQKGLEKKRYLNITLKSNIKNMNLSDWEKIFVLNYYDGQKRTLHQGQDKVEKIRKNIEEYLNELYELDEATMTIDSHSPEVIREYESEIKALKARGEDTSYLESNPERCYEEIAKKYSEQLYAEYKHIVDLIKGLDYDPAFKCMMLRETLTKTYKIDRDKESKEKKTIVKNRKLNESIAGHMILNAETLKFMYENIKNIEEYKNFANLYFAAVEIYKETIAKASGITLEGVDTFDKGKWLKFEGKGTDEEHYLENAKKLAALVQDTTWCTKQLASQQLAGGDFYVFIDNEGKPHIAVKTSGNQIDEVRGIKNGNAQELEEEYRDIAISFLENNKDIQNGKEWLEKEEWNKRLIEYKRKIDNNEFTIEDMPEFIEDYFKVDYRSHGGKNSNKTALKESLEKIKPILAQYYKCKEEEICTEDVNFKDIDLEVVPYRIIFGDADFSNSKITSLGNLNSIGGNADFSGSKVTSLGELERIGGNAYFDYSKITSLGKLHSIGGDADFRDSKITSLGELESIGGNAYFAYSEITSLGDLESIGGHACFDYSEITSLGKLHSIGRDAKFGKSKVTSLGELESIGGDAVFIFSEITSLGELESIGGNAYFEYSKITSLGKLHSIGRDANFFKSKVTSLGDLESIGGNAYFDYSKITSLGKLHSIGGDAVFSDSEITSLGDIQTIGGSIVGSEELKKQYELIQKKREKLKLTGQDIGQLGFGASVEACDGAERFIKGQREENIEKGNKK